MNPILAKQLADLGLDPECPPDSAGWHALIEGISAHYTETERGRYLSERATRLAAEEMAGLQSRLEWHGELRDSHYRNLFNESPIAIWEEDFSRAGSWLNWLRASGVADLDGYLDEHPEELRKLIGMIRIVDGACPGGHGRQGVRRRHQRAPGAVAGQGVVVVGDVDDPGEQAGSRRPLIGCVVLHAHQQTVDARLVEAALLEEAPGPGRPVPREGGWIPILVDGVAHVVEARRHTEVGQRRLGQTQGGADGEGQGGDLGGVAAVGREVAIADERGHLLGPPARAQVHQVGHQAPDGQRVRRLSGKEMGVWQRKGRRRVMSKGRYKGRKRQPIRLMYALKPAVETPKRWDFRERVGRIVHRRLDGNFSDALAIALGER